MGEWSFDTRTHPGVLYFVMRGTFTESEMRRFVDEHNMAVTSFGGRPYRVFGDLRELQPLTPECTKIIAESKKFSASHKNFEGSAIWVATRFIAMQHQRTSVNTGVANTELATEDEALAWKHLKNVHRSQT